MKKCCSPYNLSILCALLGICMLCCPHLTTAQCQGDFSFKSFPVEDQNSLGRIEVTAHDAGATTYTFKVYELSGKLTLVTTKQASSPETITFEALKPATYFVKIEWEGSCYKTLGGYEGIIITEKDQGR